MPAGRTIRELTTDEVKLSVTPESFGFETTAELTPLEEIVGQPRAMRALDLGLGIRHPNYHIYAAGMTGTGRMETIRRALADRIHDESIPPDWMFVNNFEEPDNPVAIALKAGVGIRFKQDMENLVHLLKETLPKAFRHEDFGREKDRLRKRYREQGDELFNELDTMARESGMGVQQLPDGQILFVPLKDDRPITPEEVKQLSPEEMEDLENRQQKLIDESGKVLGKQQEMEQKLSREVREVAKEFAARIIDPLVDELSKNYELEKLQNWFSRLKKHLVDHIDRFRERGAMPPPALIAAMGGEEAAGGSDQFLEYQVNLLVDNSKLEKAPVIVEDAPNYRNLFGTIERLVDRSGRVTTNFTRIKTGSLLKASGGYLILNLMDALVEPYVWKQLKRTLKSGSLELEVYDPFALFTVSGLKPEAIPLKTKLVALGEPLIYHLLYLYDEDFREIFRVKADFDEEMNRDQEAGTIYGRFVRKLSDEEQILPFHANGISELIGAGSRMADHKQKLSTTFNRLANIIREADYWARNENAEAVRSEHVRKALSEQVYRSDMIASKIRELIDDGTLLIDVQDKVTGQINGLAVANLGDYAFGRPSRLTASVGIGTSGIINIERESRLSGKTFDKGLLILEGFLRNTYAQKQALALSAGIAMEQSYGGIDGDSASVAELLCLLSALADVPLRQDIAMTGSVNQRGEVQAIGGVNEKVEGFFDVCRQQGLTGTQGVAIPASNVNNLVLRPDLVMAIEQGEFHIWAVEHVDQAMELFGGIPAGSVDDEGSFHGKVMTRLTEMSDVLKEQHTAGGDRVLAAPTAPATPPDPRPPLPGKE